MNKTPPIEMTANPLCELDFSIHDVFAALYQDACQEFSTDASFPMSELTFRYVDLLYTEWQRSGGPITTIVKGVLSKHRKAWSQIPGSPDTCFVCLRRRPEKYLPCKHWLCQSCVKDFGNQCRFNPDKFVLKSCILCGKACYLVILDRPPTAGVGLLCLEGGGVRGILQTEILCELEKRIGLPIPVQEHFQVAAGVSAGMWELKLLFFSLEWLVRLTNTVQVA